MRTPPGGLRPATIALLAAATLTPATAAATRHDLYPLHVGSAGPRCAMLKFLERDPRPARNVFSQIKGTYKRASGMGGYCNQQLANATIAYKWRLGYPRKWVKPIVGPYFVDLLLGHKKRPPDWVRVAAQRLAAIEAAQPSAVAVRWKSALLTVLGINEQPYGSNRGPKISYAPAGWPRPSIQSSTGAYGQAWCVSTQQWAGKIAGYGHFADDTAGVYYAVDYANARGWLSAKAKFGSLVAFITYDYRGRRVPGTGHMGFVSKVTASGFSYIAGNDSNGVREHFLSFGARPYVFIRLPGVA